MQFYNPRPLRRLAIVLANVPVSHYIILVLVCAIVIHCLILEERDKEFLAMKSELVAMKAELETERRYLHLQKVKNTHSKMLNNRLQFLNNGFVKTIDEILIKQSHMHEHSRGISNQSDETASPRGQQEPRLAYELLRRRVQTNIVEMWSYFSHELGKQIKNTKAETETEVSPPAAEHKRRTEINAVLQLGAEHKRSLLNDMERLRQVDGHEPWRRQESKDLSELVQRRLRHLQNPKDCKKAAKLVCKLDKSCGYGCQLHNVVYCLIIAYATERTMILKSRGWRYNKAGWEKIFQPVSESCREAHESLASKWQDQFFTPQLWFLPIIDRLRTKHREFVPLAVPQDLAPRLRRLNGDPASWWVGQFLKYLLRYQPQTQKFLKARRIKLGWKKPIVGIHVRRTDKVGTESAYHSLSEYMTHVEDYFRTLELNSSVSVPRRIFLATDDTGVIEQARKQYVHYEIIADPDTASVAGSLKTRYTSAALNGIILDIQLLSKSDFLVCTFSSQVCRVAYELMQTLHPDAAHRFKSLDDIYYFGGQNANTRRAIIAHKRRRNSDEIDLAPGDFINIMGNHWNGYSKGRNTRTNDTGLFPSFKVTDKLEVVKFPSYARVRNISDSSN